LPSILLHVFKEFCKYVPLLIKHLSFFGLINLFFNED
jgi:hypothetical protein